LRVATNEELLATSDWLTVLSNRRGQTTNESRGTITTVRLDWRRQILAGIAALSGRTSTGPYLEGVEPVSPSK